MAKHNSSGKPFFQAFFLTFSILSGMLAIGYYLIAHADRQADSSLSNLPIEDHYSPSVKDNLTVVFLGCPERNEVPSCYLVCKLDVLQSRCSILSIPPNTLATVNVSEKTVTEHYRYGGPQEAADACANLLLLEADAYVRLNTDGIRTLTDFFSGVEWTFTEVFTTKQYTYPVGKQLIDGNRMADLLLNDDFSEKGELFARLIDLHFAASFPNRSDAFYSLFFEMADTTLNRAILNKRNKPLQRFFRQAEDRVSVFYLNGSQSGEVFLPEETMLKELQNSFSEQEITKS